MKQATTYNLKLSELIAARLGDYAELVKMRLSFMVIFSAAIGYSIGAGFAFSWINLFLISLGGFLITGSSNALNQIMEKDYDKLMDRTKNRPLPAGRMGITEALLAAGIMGFSGIIILWFAFNPIASLIGALSLFLYAFLYTPLKRISPISVLVGAFPGAMPPLIGWVAATGFIGTEAIWLFTVQFLWQFPHFWAIAWLGHDDYIKAGFKLLPSNDGKSKSTAIQSMIYTFTLIPLSVIPMFSMGVHWLSILIVGLASVLYFLGAVNLYRRLDNDGAKKLMFSSIIYLPVVLLAILFGFS